MSQPVMITTAEDCFAKGCDRGARFGTPKCPTRAWAVGHLTLRRVALATGLTRTAKGGHPSYMHIGRNVALIGAFREDLRLSFRNAALLRDPENVLQKHGPTFRHADCLRFTVPATPARGTGGQPPDPRDT